MLKTFNYRIYKGSEVVYMNTIHRPTKEEALKDIEELKQEYNGTDIKLSEVKPASKWSC